MGTPVPKYDIEANIKSIKERTTEHNVSLNTRIEAVDTKMRSFDSRMGTFDSKMIALDQKVDLLCRKFDGNNASSQTPHREGSKISTGTEPDMGLNKAVQVDHMIIVGQLQAGHTKG